MFKSFHDNLLILLFPVWKYVLSCEWSGWLGKLGTRWSIFKWSGCIQQSTYFHTESFQYSFACTRRQVSTRTCCPRMCTVDVKSPKNAKTNLGLPLHLPFPDRFSIKVEKAIESGNVLPVRRQLIADLATFYHGHCSEPLQGDYKKMALKACERFPELKDVTGSSYCVWYNNHKFVN